MFSCKDKENGKVKNELKLIKPQEVVISKELRGLIPDVYENVVTETIDFDNDSKKDFICTVYDSKRDINIEYWITSNYKLFLVNEFYGSINYKFFIKCSDAHKPRTK